MPFPASALCFLSGLPSKTVGQKLRFLGCVTAYDTSAGVLTLQHPYQPQPTARRIHVYARVNVDLVLERLTAEQTTVGAWVNVVGYMTSIVDASEVHVQAVLLWSAGPLDLQGYERNLESLLSTCSTGSSTGT
ncbi:hypothetical protein SEUCBS139899_003656 [Sporothrix eucalyptigena]|uniref:CST complex subunit Ten1 n=1 Tax=Sporothrix eucalyptigena TaxID=1812306 RepID=A0ABP0CRE3_9PEZI